MVVMTAKLSKKKLLFFLVAVIGVVVLISLCVKSGSSDAPGEATENDDRLAFLSSFGYSVKGEPTQTQTVVIPSEPSELFDSYNELQKSQGYDLTKYSGQTVCRYVYELENYDESGTQWFATVLVADGQIIGGDVASSAPGGEMHGFERPAGH